MIAALTAAIRASLRAAAHFNPAATAAAPKYSTTKSNAVAQTPPISLQRYFCGGSVIVWWLLPQKPSGGTKTALGAAHDVNGVQR